MHANEIKKWLLLLGAKGTSEGQAWVQARCPLAPWRHSGSDSNPSFGVEVSHGESKVYCFGCGFGGTQTSLLMELRFLGAEGVQWRKALDMLIAADDETMLGLPNGDYEDDVFGVEAAEYEFPEWLVKAFEPAYFEGTVHPYLTSRHTPLEVAQHLDLRYDVHRRRVVFPVRDWSGRLMGLHGRHIGGPYTPDDIQNAYRMYPYQGHTNPRVWLGEHWIEIDQPVVLAESVFDLARTMEVYSNVLSPLTASITGKKLERLAGIKRIVTLFDADAAGDAAREKTAKHLTGSDISHVELPAGCDAGEMSPEELNRALLDHLS